jgi:hypothetical protein
MLPIAFTSYGHPIAKEHNDIPARRKSITFLDDVIDLSIFDKDTGIDPSR